MKTIPSSRRHHYVARVGTFLIMVALMAGMVGCAPAQYKLTISSTAGGSVTVPEEGTYTYDEGELVNLVATPDAGYRFVEWIGDVDDIADVDDATTTITMNDNYSITANFALIPPAQYDLIISSTVGGEVTAPGEGIFNYDKGTDVDLVAVADEGHEFIGWTGDVGTIGNVNDATSIITMNGDYDITANFEYFGFGYVPMVAAGGFHTLGLRSDGTVVAVGDNAEGQCDVGGWTGIVQVAAGAWHTVGLRADGTVVAVGNNAEGQCNVGGWDLT